MRLRWSNVIPLLLLGFSGWLILLKNTSFPHATEVLYSKESKPFIYDFKFHCYDLPDWLEKDVLEKARKHPNVSEIFDWKHSSSHFAAEHLILLHIREHPLHTNDPEEADIFLVPNLAVIYRRLNLTRYINDVFNEIYKHPYYKRNNGFDHFAVNVRWANLKKFMSNISYIVYEMKTATPPIGARQEFRNDFPLHYRHIVIPYPELSPILQESSDIQQRSFIAAFVGTLTKNSREVRLALVKQLKSRNDTFVSTLSYRHSIESVYEVLKHTAFCPSPTGDSDSARRTFSAILAGCIPVIICDWCIMPYENLVNWEDFSVFIPEQDVKDGKLFEILDGFSESEITEKQAALRKVRHHFQYHDGSPQPGDAVDTLVQELMFHGMILRQFKRWMSLH